MEKIIDVTHVSSRGTSLRITIPKKVQERLGIKGEDILVFMENQDKVVIKKLE